MEFDLCFKFAIFCTYSKSIELWVYGPLTHDVNLLCIAHFYQKYIHIFIARLVVVMVISDP